MLLASGCPQRIEGFAPLRFALRVDCTVDLILEIGNLNGLSPLGTGNAKKRYAENAQNHARSPLSTMISPAHTGCQLRADEVMHPVEVIDIKMMRCHVPIDGFDVQVQAVCQGV